jgi:hypothetical protein
LQNYQYEEEKTKLEKRVSDNQGLIEDYQKVQENIEKKITGVLDQETQKREKIIQRETTALLRLIALRQQAGIATTPAPTTQTQTTNVANTTNNNGNTNINVTD